MASPTVDKDVDVIDPTNPDADTICSVCFAEFLDVEDLKIHLEQMHSISKKLTLRPCPFCENSYGDDEALAYHIRNDHLSRLNRCKFCAKVFANAQNHRNHEKKHKSTIKGMLLCSQCTETFTNTSELENHESDLHANNFDGFSFKEIHPHLSSILNINLASFMINIGLDISFTCLQCNFSSYDMVVYINHLKTQNCRSLTCNDCGNIYKYRRGLQTHYRNKQCASDINDYIQCKECKRDIKKLVFKQHIKNCKIYKCVICDIVFETMVQLSNHQSSEHPLSVEIKHCKFCSRECVGTLALRKHLERTHKDDFHLYKYMCKECKEVFKHPQKLFAHYFTKHKELEPYTCKICDKKFRIRKKFTLHIKLDHKSVGFVEFDDNYHVSFVEKKSDNPFIPQSLINDESFGVDMPGLTSLLNRSKEKDTKIQKPNNNPGVKDLQETNKKEDTKGCTTEVPTETEGNVTEVESKLRKRKYKQRKKNVPSKRVKKEETIILDSTDEDEPLQSLKNKQPKKKNMFKNDKTRFTCNICNKYCYTYQNYHNHMNLHSKSEKKTCIKCSQEFTSSDKLEQHMKNEHSSSKLTEYLRNILEKRKMKEQTDRELTLSEKFQLTIKKVKTDHFSNSARLQAIENGQSVKNFIESFTPEGKYDKNILINSNVTVKAINTPFYRQPVIKMKKFEPEEEIREAKLAMPVKCARDNIKVDVTVRLVQATAQSNFQIQPEPIYDDDTFNDDIDNTYDIENDNSRDDIPEVADEVMIENEEPVKEVHESKPVQRTIVIENIPKNYADISIAHLLPEAPYFKIVKVNKILKKDEKEEEEKSNEEINLPNGTKLVTVNPLAHLLGDKPVEEVLQPTKNKYYKPKPRNFEHLLKKALLNLDNCPKNRYRKRNSTKNAKAQKDASEA